MSDRFSPRRSAAFSSSGRKPFFSKSKHTPVYNKPTNPRPYTTPSRDDLIDRFLPPRYHSPR